MRLKSETRPFLGKIFSLTLKKTCTIATYDHTVIKRYRRSYMSAHVLLNLSNELGKRDKMRNLPSILSLFRNKFNKFNKQEQEC